MSITSFFLRACFSYWKESCDHFLMCTHCCGPPMLRSLYWLHTSRHTVQIISAASYYLEICFIYWWSSHCLWATQYVCSEWPLLINQTEDCYVCSLLCHQLQCNYWDDHLFQHQLSVSPSKLTMQLSSLCTAGRLK